MLDREVLAISAVTGQGIPQLIHRIIALWEMPARARAAGAALCDRRRQPCRPRASRPWVASWPTWATPA